MTPGYWQTRQRTRTRQGEKRTEYDGYSFSSKLEASVYQQLKLRQKAGEFDEIKCQVTVRVCGVIGHECMTHGKIDYIVDFECIKIGDSPFYVEAKGFETPHWKLKKRLWMHNGPGRLEIYKGTWLRPVLIETVRGA